METKLSFGQWVKQRRKALDLTQKALAKRIGCSLSEIQKIEIGVRQPSQQMAALLAEHLDLAPDERATFLHLARHQADAPPLVLPVLPTSHDPTDNLPTPLTSLIGREWEVATVRASLRRPEVRLLTITGPPGIGKTRLSLQVATEIQASFADGVVFVTLAPISDATFVIATIVRTLGLKDAGNQSLLAQLKAYLRHKELLLVLDNFEHVLSAAPLLAELLESAPHLKVLITSRALLQLYGEHEFVTPPLALPNLKQLPTSHELAGYAAIELFVQRAQAAKLEFVLSEQNAASVAQLCMHLDGLPLAIELAAAHSKQLAPDAILDRLVNPHDSYTAHFAVVSGGARNLPSRQQTLHNAIAWSYNLLSPTEQRIFRRLGVFAGGCTLEALAAVVSYQSSVSGTQASPKLDQWLPNIVLTLVNQSLVIQQSAPDGELRFLLLEMLREYALEQLVQLDEATAARQAHAFYFLQLAERFRTVAAEDKEATLLNRMELEVDNFRTALRWAYEHDFALALRFSVAISEYWSQRRDLGEGRQWLEQLCLRIKAATLPLPPQQMTQYAQISGMLAFFTWLQGDCALAQRRWEETIPLWRELRNEQELGLALHFLAYTFYDRGDYTAAYGPAQDAVAILRAAGEPWALGWALVVLGSLMTISQEYVAAQAIFEEALAILQRIGHTWSISMLALSISELLFAQGNLVRARIWLEEALPVFEKSTHLWMMAQTLSLLGKVHWRQGDKTQAINLWNESVILAREIGAKRFLAEIYAMLGLAAQAQNDRQQAETLFRQSFALYGAVENRIGAAYALSGLAGLVEPAARQAHLLGAASTVLDKTRLPYDAIERAHYEQLIVNVRAQLDEATFAAAWAQGQAMSLAEAVALVQPRA